jgi:sulfite exporter TauE/SafE
MTPELLLPAAFAAGFFGSTHCLVMCGPIVLLFEGGRQHVKSGFLRRIAYNLGRMLFYVVLGTLAGASGALMTSELGGLSVLRVVAAALIILLGLNLVFDWRSLQFLESAGGVIWKKISPLARYVLPITSPGHALAAGFLWGALPCGLVYSAVALAATSGGAIAGTATMMAFWFGTLPALLLAGRSAEGLSRWTKSRRTRVVAGLLLIIVGAISVGLPILNAGGHGMRLGGLEVAPPEARFMNRSE